MSGLASIKNERESMYTLIINGEKKEYAPDATWEDVAKDYQKDFDSPIAAISLDGKIRELLRFLMDHFADATLYSDEGIFFTPYSTRKAFVNNYNRGLDPSKQSPVIDIGPDFPDREKIPAFNKILLISADSAVTDVLSADPDLEVISSGPTFFDVMPGGVTKGKALLSLAEYLGIPASATFAIGDSDNDLSMIEAAAYGIAMGNATENCKKAASYITSNCDSLGFAKAVDEYVIPLVRKFS